MGIYKHIIIAVDLLANSNEILEHGIQIAKEHNAKITILHAVEHINAYGVAQVYPTVVDIEEQMSKDAKTQLEALRQKYGLIEANIVVSSGSPKMVIIDKVKELRADLIIIGSHGRHGLQLLLGSTANAILHHAPCDVLAVRIK